MKFIPTSVHAVIDYVMGMGFAAAPWVLDYAEDPAAMWSSVVIGFGMVAYGFLTRYEMGIVRLLPMRMHLWLDCTGGAFLLATPWLLNDHPHKAVWFPHFFVGAFALSIALLTVNAAPMEKVRAQRDLARTQ